jgi:hypothetical protein
MFHQGPSPTFLSIKNIEIDSMKKPLVTSLWKSSDKTRKFTVDPNEYTGCITFLGLRLFPSQKMQMNAFENRKILGL